MIVKCVLLAFAAVVSGNPLVVGTERQRVAPITHVLPINHGNPDGASLLSAIYSASARLLGDYPYHVALFIDNLYFCSGTLISDQWVLTAAHCTDGAGFVDVIMGTDNIGVSGGVTVRSSELITHEDYNPFTLHNDIALIKLPIPVAFNDYINAVSLPTESDPEPGTLVTLTFWASGVQTADTAPVVSNADCAAVYGSMVSEGMICTEQTDCSGDSGGPMTRDDQLFGVRSFSASAGCEAGLPQGFTRVSYFLDWIEAQSGVTPLTSGL